MLNTVSITTKKDTLKMYECGQNIYNNQHMLYLMKIHVFVMNEMNQRIMRPCLVLQYPVIDSISGKWICVAVS